MKCKQFNEEVNDLVSFVQVDKFKDGKWQGGESERNWG